MNTAQELKKAIKDAGVGGRRVLRICQWHYHKALDEYRDRLKKDIDKFHVTDPLDNGDMFVDVIEMTTLLDDIHKELRG